MKFTFFMSNISKPIIITTEDQNKEVVRELIQKAMSNSLVLYIENRTEFAVLRGSTINFVLGQTDAEPSIYNSDNSKILDNVRISVPDEIENNNTKVEVN